MEGGGGPSPGDRAMGNTTHGVYVRVRVRRVGSSSGKGPVRLRSNSERQGEESEPTPIELHGTSNNLNEAFGILY